MNSALRANVPIPEGTPIFPNEPVITVRAPAIEAQFIETFLLLTFNHQSLIATKTNRIVRASQGRPVSKFGSRRAHGPDAAVNGARAAYIGGCSSTACTIAGRVFGIPVGGTMAHSWVQMFDSEYEAFRRYCEIYPDNPTLLVDTYSVLKSGVPNAIRVFKEMLSGSAQKNCAIRIDSGDLTYLSRRARKMLDDDGLKDCRSSLPNSLDEIYHQDLLQQGHVWTLSAVGRTAHTSRSAPVLAGILNSPRSRETEKSFRK